MTANRPMPRAQRAFTLLELMVVIAIIAILAALTMFGVSKAKLKARQIRCTSNLRQLALHATMYINDQRRPMLREHPDYPDGNWMGTLFAYYGVKDEMLCPSAPLQKPVPTPQQINGQGTADRAWVRWTSDGKTMFHGSYGYNGWLYETDKIRQDQRDYFIDAESKIGNPSRVPLFADANWVDLWPNATDRPCNDLYVGRSLYTDGHDMGRVAIARHGSQPPSSAPRNITSSDQLVGAVDLIMFDGHVESAKLRDLWSYDWHRGWKTPATIPAPWR